MNMIHSSRFKETTLSWLWMGVALIVLYILFPALLIISKAEENYGPILFWIWVIFGPPFIVNLSAALVRPCRNANRINKLGAAIEEWNG